MKHFVKIVKVFQPLTIFAKLSILDVWQGSEYTYDQYDIFSKYEPAQFWIRL